MEAEQAAELQQLRQSHEEMKRDNEVRNEKIDSMMALLQQLVKGKNVQEDTQTTEGQVTATSGVNTAAGTSGEGGGNGSTEQATMPIPPANSYPYPLVPGIGSYPHPYMSAAGMTFMPPPPTVPPFTPSPPVDTSHLNESGT
ncbi:hypothetical protein COLO4_05124, partial [Corchorus olitorius]